MKLSMILRGDIGGLGTLSRIFYDCFRPHRSLSLSFRDQRNDDKFFCAATNRIVRRGGQISQADAEWLVDGADVVLSLETFYSPEVTFAAHRAGIKIALVPMFEQLPMGGIRNSYITHAVCPHELCRREVQITPSMRDARAVVLPLPIDTERIPFRRRERARTFVHFTKEGDRDGTPNTLAAWSHVKSDARLIVYVHGEPPQTRDERIEFRRRDAVDYWTGYADGDVLIHCHRWAGYCCPFAEALAAGMPIITTRFWPFCRTSTLPQLIGPAEPDLIDRYQPDGAAILPPSSQRFAVEPAAMRRVVIARPILAFETTPEAIAARVDEIYDSEISAASDDGRAWAEARSFDALCEQWLRELAA